MPSFSHERITDAEIPVASATSPIFRCPCGAVRNDVFVLFDVFCFWLFNDLLDKQEVDSLTLRDYSKVAFSCK